MKKSPLEASIVIENHPCEVMKLISSLNLNAFVENVKLGDNVTDHIVNFDDLDNTQYQKLRLASLKTMRLSDSKVWIRTSGCAVCKLLYSSDVVVEKVKVVGEKALIYNLLIPNMSSLKDLLKKLNDIGVKSTVMSIMEIEENQLTERQMEILKMAFKLGYFDDDRKISMSELAEKLGISAPTLEEILRRALRKVVKNYLDKSS
ncbi:helix-turn-helix domain-containing protein [Acidianus manzaensis]|uniref:RNA polymerase subunit sigma-70 n=1 Tax=Acidianus manzaensis TaxID=282676 RepID=A0A1W6K320_9CREN|nr:helix-turn-helix domain-containing protein [Acidianus manzaensis]ARM76897.1 RNA polymerase subunit sigma-70 [Acidianus manzaensis]